MEGEVRKYDVIYADPPWHYKVWNKKGKGRTAEHHYTTQKPDYLKNINVPALCNKDCILFMWATFPCLIQALELGAAWGFIYKTVAFTWIKKNRNNERLFIGLGHYTRSNAEIVLLFVKGKSLKRVAKNVSQVLISNRSKHSEKPSEIRSRIVQLFGDVPRVELFARSREGLFPDVEFSGWDVFGNEVNNSIILPE